MTNETCGCCEGLTNISPRKTGNRPGLNSLAYRVGTHATFLETMKARLSSLYLDLPCDNVDTHGKPLTGRVYPLRNLMTRADNDPSIALLDSWAMVGTVLTFYQERIANEGYLNTATERRSILELARLIGYALRPGVSASVFLAYNIDSNTKEQVIIPAGAKSQTIPDPGENAQTFETSEPLEARAAWNNLKPRQTRPQTQSTIITKAGKRVYLKGISTNLKPNEPLLIDFGDSNPKLFRIVEVKPDATLDHTLVTMTDWLEPKASNISKYKAGLLELANRLQDLSGLSRSIANAEMVGRVVNYLKTLAETAHSAATDAEIVEFLNNKTLPGLQQELAAATSDKKYVQVKKWLEPMVMELSNAAKTGPTLHVLTERIGIGSDSLVEQLDSAVAILGKLALPASVPPRNTLYLARDLNTAFASKADIGAQLVTTFQPTLSKTLATALSRGKITADNNIQVYALRTKAAPFGSNAPKRILQLEPGTGVIKRVGEWPIVESETEEHESENVLFLDGSYDKILPDSWLVVDMGTVPNFGGSISIHVEPAERPFVITKVITAQANLARAEYGISGKTTRLNLGDHMWLKIKRINVVPQMSNIDTPQSVTVHDVNYRDFQVLRNTIVYAQSEELALADQPIEETICSGAHNWIELDGWCTDLKSGRSLIVSGERTDITMSGNSGTVTGVTANELVMLAAVIQDVATEDGTPASQNTQEGNENLPDETTHTFVKFAKDLAYCYKRNTVMIYGNVVKATNGESRMEVLGAGDGSKTLQSFTLRQPPMTYVAAPNPSGVDSTLKVYVNEVQWHEVASLARLKPTDRKYITRTDDDVKTTVLFGNGRQGARLPTGLENVRAAYRNGIGKSGNVKAEQISLLMTRPLGVKSVINPLRASGGADRENRDQARRNAPLAVMALDRLVSVQDYADFARTFAGIGKAAATRLAVRNRELVHVTIAGADDIPIDTTSDLYRNLLLAIRGNGDPYQPFQIGLRELMLLVISAGVRILPDYLWDNVVTQMRARLLATFSFERRELGQDVFLCEVISVMQAVPGVAYVDVDLFTAIPEKKTDKGSGKRRLLTPDEITRTIGVRLNIPLEERKQGMPYPKQTQPQTKITVYPTGEEADTIRPAQLAILSPTVPDTLILNQIL
jgi:hypothetical protein